MDNQFDYISDGMSPFLGYSFVGLDTCGGGVDFINDLQSSGVAELLKDGFRVNDVTYSFDDIRNMYVADNLPGGLQPYKDFIQRFILDEDSLSCIKNNFFPQTSTTETLTEAVSETLTEATPEATSEVLTETLTEAVSETLTEATPEATSEAISHIIQQGSDGLSTEAKIAIGIVTVVIIGGTAYAIYKYKNHKKKVAAEKEKEEASDQTMPKEKEDNDPELPKSEDHSTQKSGESGITDQKEPDSDSSVKPDTSPDFEDLNNTNHDTERVEHDNVNQANQERDVSNQNIISNLFYRLRGAYNNFFHGARVEAEFSGESDGSGESGITDQTDPESFSNRLEGSSRGFTNEEHRTTDYGNQPYGIGGTL